MKNKFTVNISDDQRTRFHQIASEFMAQNGVGEIYNTRVFMRGDRFACEADAQGVATLGAEGATIEEMLTHFAEATAL